MTTNSRQPLFYGRYDKDDGTWFHYTRKHISMMEDGDFAARATSSRWGIDLPVIGTGHEPLLERLYFAIQNRNSSLERHMFILPVHPKSPELLDAVLSLMPVSEKRQICEMVTGMLELEQEGCEK